MRVDDFVIAVPVRQVEEVTPIVLVSPLPKAPAAVRGTFPYRGRLVPVLDIRFALGGPLAPLTPDLFLVIVSTAERPFALAVGGVDEVHRFGSNDVEPAPLLTSLPAFVLGASSVPAVMRLTRTGLIEVMSADYIRTARSKGYRGLSLLWRHALRNALVPVLTIMGLQLGQLLAGAIIIENVYFLPGLGRLVFNAIGLRDLPVVRDIVLFMAAAVVVVNCIVDLTYAALDPRIRLQ